MILLALRGENFMKFRRVCIEAIPRRGLFCIEGENEGGKTSIAELIQFALFGRSLTSTEGALSDLIHWDQQQCVVELEFEQEAQGGAAGYRVWRAIDRFGANYARLFRIDDNTEIAAGAVEVQEHLFRILHLDFQDYCRSFFMAESEAPRSPKEMRAFLDHIVGCDLLERASAAVREEITECEADFTRVQSEITRNELQIEKYAPNVARVPELIEARSQHARRALELREQERDCAQFVEQEEKEVKPRERLRERLRQAATKPIVELGTFLRPLSQDRPQGAGSAAHGESRALVAGLGELADAYKNVCAALDAEVVTARGHLFGDGERALPRLEKQAERRRRRAVVRAVRARILGLVLLCFGVVLLATWISDAVEIISLSRTLSDSWEIAASTLRRILLGAAFALAGAGSLFVLYGKRERIRQSDAISELAVLAATRRDEEEQLAAMERFPRDSVSCDGVETMLSRASAHGIRQALENYRGVRSRVFAGDRTLASVLQDAAHEEHKHVQRLRGALKEKAREAQRLGEERKREESRGDRIESEIREYQKQDGRRAALAEQNQLMRRDAALKREAIEVRQLLVALLEESADSVRQRAGPSLGRSLRRLLPSLTGGRYVDLHVTPDFRLRLFTSEKSDFLAEHELSGGTYEGLAFGFRLVFSQAFIRAVTHAPQFLFLDEPFRAMDAKRIHQTLLALSRLSAELQQIFIVLPILRDEDRAIFDEIVTTAVGVSDFVYYFGGRESQEQAGSAVPWHGSMPAGAEAESASKAPLESAPIPAESAAPSEAVPAAAAEVEEGAETAPMPARSARFRPSVWFGASFVPGEPEEGDRADD